MSSYENYLNQISSHTQSELEIDNLNKMKDELFEEKVRDAYEKLGDVALTLHGGSELLRNLQGLYNKGKNLKKKFTTNEDDTETMNNMKKPIETSDTTTPQSVEEVKDTPKTPVEDEPIDLGDDYSIEKILGREQQLRATQPKTFSDLFEEGASPRGVLGQSPVEQLTEAVRPSRLSYQSPADLTRQLATVEEEADPYALGPGELNTYSALEQYHMRMAHAQDIEAAEKSSIEKGLRGSKEQDFKYQAPTKEEWEAQRTAKQGLTEGEDEGDIFSRFYQSGQKLPMFEGSTEVGEARMGMQRGSSILARVQAEPIELQPVASYQFDRPQTISRGLEQPKPVEAEPVEAQPVKSTITPQAEQLGGEDVESSLPSVSDIGEKVSTKIGEKLTATAGEELGEEGILSSIPVVGEFAAVGLGIASLVDMFKSHHEPAVKRGLTTGIANVPTSVESGVGGYV